MYLPFRSALIAALTSRVMVLSSSLGAMDCIIFVFRGRTMDTDGADSVLNRAVTILSGLSTWRTSSATFTSSSDKVTMTLIFLFRALSVSAENIAACCSR